MCSIRRSGLRPPASAELCEWSGDGDCVKAACFGVAREFFDCQYTIGGFSVRVEFGFDVGELDEFRH